MGFRELPGGARQQPQYAELASEHLSRKKSRAGGTSRYRRKQVYTD